MPTSVLFNGQRLYRPGVYLRVVDATSGPTSLQAGNIAVVGDFPALRKAKLYTFAQPETMSEFFFPAGENGSRLRPNASLKEVQDVANISFGDLTVPTELGTIDSITLISVRDSVASKTVQDGMRIESKFYGDIGEQLTVKLAANADTASLWDLKLFVGGTGGTLLEKFEAIGDGVGDFPKLQLAATAAGELSYVAATVEVELRSLTNPVSDGESGSDADFDAGASLESGKKLIVRGSVSIPQATLTAAAADALVFEPRSASMGGGKVSITATGAAPTALILSVNGFDEDGVAASEELEFDAATTLQTTKVFKSITSVSHVSGGDTAGGAFTVNFPIKSANLEDIEDIQDFLNDLVSLDARFTVDGPAVPVSGDMLDRRTATSILGTDVELKTDTFRIYNRALNLSQFLRVKRISNEAPSAFESRLSGGSNGAAPDSADWQAALDSMLYENINIVVPFTSTFELHELAVQHCRDAATKAGLERNLWLGTSPDLSVNAAYLSWSKPINDANVAIVFQGLNLLRAGSAGPIAKIEPYWTALSLAVMQARTPISEPLTRKVFSSKVIGLLNSSLSGSPADYAEEAIRKGLVILGGQRSPYRVERSNTCYLKNPDHPVFTEVSSVESVNVSVRDVRQYLDEVIGGKATADKLNVVASLVRDRLTQQRSLEIISDFRDVSVSLSGDKINVSYFLKAQQPLNFILVNTYLTA